MVEVIIRIALMFFFIQFLVVVGILAAAILRARPEPPILNWQFGRSTFGRLACWLLPGDGSHSRGPSAGWRERKRGPSTGAPVSPVK